MATSFDLGGLLGSAFGDDDYSDLLTPAQQSSIRDRSMLAAAAALLQAGGPSTTRTTLGQALGSALTAGQAGAERAQQSALAGMMTRQKLEEARRAREIQANIARILGGGEQVAPAGQTITPDMALAAPVTEGMPAGPTVARAGMIGQAAPAAPAMTANEMQSQRYRQAANVYTASGRTEDAKRMIDIAEQLAPTRQKVIGEPIQTRTGWVQRTESGGFIELPKDFEPQVRVKPIGEPLTVTDEASGNQILVQRFDDNTIKPLEGFGPKRDLVLQTVDGKIVAIDKNKVTAGQTFGTGTYIPPAERERLDIERERLQISRDEFERGNYERQETPSGIMYVPRVPGGRVIPLADVSGEPLMGMEAQRLQIALRQLDISQAEFDRGRYEKTVTDQGIVYVPKVPGMPVIPITDSSGKPLMGFTPSPSEVRTLEATGTPVTFENVMRLRQSGAARTNVDVRLPGNQQFLAGAGTEVAQTLGNLTTQARAANDTLATIDRIRPALDSAITGPAAEYRTTMLRIGQQLGVGGQNDAEKLSNTRTLVQGLAQMELDAAAGMRGQGALTEGERGILRRAAAGDQTLSLPELNAAMNAAEKVARRRIASQQDFLDRAKKLPGFQQLAPLYEVNPYQGAGGGRAGTPSMSNAIDAELQRRQQQSQQPRGR